MNPIRIEEVEKNTNAFIEANGGARPTHILMTVEQQDELSEFLKSSQRIQVSTDYAQGRVVTLQVLPDLAVDILAVAATRTGTTNEVDYPVLLNLSTGEKQ
jgi:hypothetical protein